MAGRDAGRGLPAVTVPVTAAAWLVTAAPVWAVRSSPPFDAGRADAGLGIMAAAAPFGLDFVPVAREPYDLVVAPGALDGPQLAPLWSLLRDPGFQASVEALGGYSTREMGRRLR